MKNNIGKRIGEDGKRKRKKRVRKQSDSNLQFGVIVMRKPFPSEKQVMCLFVFKTEEDAKEFAAYEMGELSYLKRFIGKGNSRMRSCFVDISPCSITFKNGYYVYSNDGTGETVRIVRDITGTGFC